jgi:EAL domain-containing protein (putative c-di-GMP-specific phosphodiesterase class I)
MSVIGIDADSFVIGRRPGVSLQLASQRVSGRHAEILKIGGHLFIRDLGSTNGTFVNRRRVRQPTPIVSGDHIEIADVEFRIEQRVPPSATTAALLPSLKKTAHAIDSLESDWTMSQFDRLLKEKAVIPHYQPIIQLNDHGRLGYEALARSGMVGLEHPAVMFQTAQLVNRQVELSMVCRSRALEIARDFPMGSRVFVNTHPHECLEIDVLPSLLRLRDQCPTVQIVVEIHEGTVQQPETIQTFADALRDNGIELAYDDFGAGQARLLELVKTPPDYLKFDACLIRGIDRANSNQWKMLKMLVDIARDIPTITLAEGIETQEEAEACRDLGFELGQGFLFGRPQALERWLVSEVTHPQSFRLAGLGDAARAALRNGQEKA